MDKRTKKDDETSWDTPRGFYHKWQEFWDLGNSWIKVLILLLLGLALLWLANYWLENVVGFKGI